MRYVKILMTLLMVAMKILAIIEGILAARERTKEDGVSQPPPGPNSSKSRRSKGSANPNR